MLAWPTLSQQHHVCLLNESYKERINNLLLDVTFDIVGPQASFFSYEDGKALIEGRMPSQKKGLHLAFRFYQTHKALLWLNRQAMLSTLPSLSMLHTLYALVAENSVPSFQWRTKNLKPGYGINLASPTKIPDLINPFLEWFQKTEVSEEESDTMHPVQKAAEAAYALLYIHPFETSSKPLAHLIANFVLFSHNYPPVLLGENLHGPKDHLLKTFYLSMEAILNRVSDPSHNGTQTFFHTTVEASPKTPMSDVSPLKKPPHTEKKQASPSIHKPKLRIGKLAKEVGESIPTLNFWTQEGLLDTPSRSSTGYRLYTPETLERVRTIQDLKAKRLTLKEIKKTLKKKITATSH